MILQIIHNIYIYVYMYIYIYIICFEYLPKDIHDDPIDNITRYSNLTESRKVLMCYFQQMCNFHGYAELSEGRIITHFYDKLDNLIAG